MNIAFIPTAANVESGKKDWLIRNFNECEKLGDVDIVDISALPERLWLPRLKASNVIFVGGGNTSHLMRCVNFSGLAKRLPLLLEKRTYVGISAGSIILGKTLNASSEYLYGDEEKKAPKGLGFVDFDFRPHLNSPDFPRVTGKNLEKIIEKLNGDLYAVDGNSAILVNGNKIQVISEGKWKIFRRQK